MGAIVNTPEPMVRMRVVTTRDRTSQTLNVLQRVGVLHAEESTELQPIDREAIEKERRRVSELLTSIQDVLNYASVDEMVKVKQEVDVYLTRPLEEIGEETTRLCTKLGAMHQRAEKLRQEKEQLEEAKTAVVGLASRLDLTTADLNFTGQHLFSRLIALPRESYLAVGTQLEQMVLTYVAVEAEEWTYVHVIAKTDNANAVDAFVADNGGRYLQIPGGGVALTEFAAKADEEAGRIESELSKLRAEITAATSERLEDLVLLREALFAENERLAVLEKACEAQYVTLIEGWVPESAVQTAIGDLKEEISYTYIETREAKQEEEPPTKMRNPKALRPFEVVVNLFGTPKYREWDPTPIIAYSFAFFYGVMLGDAIYGALLILLTRFVLPKLVDDPQTEGFCLFRTLLYISASVAVIMGVLTGTYLGDFFVRFFGAPNLALSQAVQHVYLDTMTFIVVSLAIGLIHVNIGHTLMLIRGIKEKQKHLVIGRVGLFILQIAGIPWMMHFIGSDLLPLAESTYSILLYIVLFSVALIVIASLMEKGPFLGSIFWIFDITGILGDVMSYARLAGVGLATYFLAYCFNLMSELVANMLPAGIIRIVLGTLVMIIILLFGHVLNLVLSSITCFVHSLRLCFVEFLFKFYEGGGRPYRPLRLRKREVIPVRAKA